jgi:1-deoxy-D-xylulose-5-phosphate synthase
MSSDAVYRLPLSGWPKRVRYPRGNAVGVELQPLEKLAIGKGLVKRRGEKVAI